VKFKFTLNKDATVISQKWRIFRPSRVEQMYDTAGDIPMAIEFAIEGSEVEVLPYP
jgi:hypothetical protein